MTNQTLKKNISKYPYPFSGKPTPIKLTALFLICPTMDIKIYGASMSGLYSQIGKASLFKRYDQAMKGSRNLSPTLIDDLISEISTNPKLAEKFGAAANEDENALREINQLGLWESFLLGVYGENPRSVRDECIVDIERISTQAAKLIHNGKFNDAAKLLTNDSVMSEYFWPDAITAIQNASNAQELIPLQLSITIEILLSLLAAEDVECGIAIHNLESPILADILPTPDNPKDNPTARLFKWLKKEIGAKSISSILADPRSKEITIDETTLKRWSSGDHHPEPNTFKKLVEAFFEKPDHARIWAKYWGAKNLNFIGYIAQVCTDLASQLNTKHITGSAYPWPDFPFGFNSIESWWQARYYHWYEQHKLRRSINQ